MVDAEGVKRIATAAIYHTIRPSSIGYAAPLNMLTCTGKIVRRRQMSTWQRSSSSLKEAASRNHHHVLLAQRREGKERGITER